MYQNLDADQNALFVVVQIDEHLLIVSGLNGLEYDFASPLREKRKFDIQYIRLILSHL